MDTSIPVTAPSKLHAQIGEGKSVHFIDVRSPAEYHEGHAIGAMSFPVDELNTTRLKIRLGSAAGMGEPLHLICASGLRAEQAARKLQTQGLHNLVLVDGGTEAWAQQQLPMRHANIGLSLARQTHIALGSLILLMLTKGALLHPLFYALVGLLGIGLIFSGVTARCGLTALLAKMPWNRNPAGGATSSA
jgi:rhodanese-related sulfurtransferase